ncbi:Nuclear pore glycoprotein [Nesidiocoris tenuis]|nr:Nuclear pore glycoprotein [Nesidiocoris tenuis]
MLGGGGLGGVGGQAKGTPTSASSSTTVPADRMTFSQLEDCINKWTADLLEEEKTFLTQATQINAWDNAINENESRLATLNNSVKQVEEQQTRIQYDLDFILTQLRDLELCLSPWRRKATHT